MATPPANDLVTREQLAIEQERYPLHVYQCRGCHHVQLLHIVDPEHVFRHYHYLSGTSPVFVNHLRQQEAWARERFQLSDSALVLEIASNDGTLLEFFSSNGSRVLGVDPAKNIAELAERRGVRTWPEFFTLEVAKEILRSVGPPALVIANNVLAHIDNLEDCLAGLSLLLSAGGGALVFEVSYLADVIAGLHFDTIYHEHVSYHSIIPLVPFLRRYGLELIDVLRVDSQGGSIRCVVQSAGPNVAPGPSVISLIESEQDSGLDSKQAMNDFAVCVEDKTHQLSAFLRGLVQDGKRLAAYGASAKATTLLYQLGVTREMMEFIVDDNPHKKGLFTPGLHIPVLGREVIMELVPDYVLITGWNFADSIMQMNVEYQQRGGTFVVPFPDLRLVNNQQVVK